MLHPNPNPALSYIRTDGENEKGPTIWTDLDAISHYRFDGERIALFCVFVLLSDEEAILVQVNVPIF